MDILTIDHLTKVYGSGPTALKALDDVSFSVAAGEFVAIVGSSGSGKSTLLHLMGGVDRPTSGTVLLNGADVYARSDEELAAKNQPPLYDDAMNPVDGDEFGAEADDADNVVRPAFSDNGQ